VGGRPGGTRGAGAGGVKTWLVGSSPAEPQPSRWRPAWRRIRRRRGRRGGLRRGRCGDLTVGDPRMRTSGVRTRGGGDVVARTMGVWRGFLGDRD